jgi:precorrin-6A/cobalt-precorrin-6A reductase
MNQPEAPKVLLLGGTSETAPLALKLANTGYRVLVSTATDEVLRIGEHVNISRRSGRLGMKAMAALLADDNFSALVDATHPYANEVHQIARHASEQVGLPYLRFQRQETQVHKDDWVMAENHEEAALLACDYGLPILLTTGSRNLNSYVQEAGRKGVEVFARVLEHEESIRACNEAGLKKRQRILGRGPFSYEDNLALIRRFRIGVVVSKESGDAGGVMEKWRAAQEENCKFIVVKRPLEMMTSTFNCMNALLSDLSRHEQGCSE